jgi:succinoglycan biosynthesis transport protein ExoP
MTTSQQTFAAPPRQVSDEACQPSSAAELIHSTLRFARLLYQKRMYVIASLAVTGLLGVLYLGTAPRIYQANAAVLVTQLGNDQANAWTADTMRESAIPTFEKLFTYPVVLENALAKLEKQPPIARLDLEEIPRDRWVTTLRDNLRAAAARRTNIIDLSYRSRSRESAERVLRAIVDSYLEFIEKNHKNLSLEYVTILEQKRQEKEEELKHTQDRLLEVQRQAGDLGIRAANQVTHPLVQRVVKLNEAYVEVQKQRLQLEALADAVAHAVRNGGDLQQHLLDLEPVVGRELLMNLLGLNPQYAQMAGDIERRMIENAARLDTLRRHYGPTHPQIQELQQTLANQEQFLRQYQQRVQQRLATLHQGQLGALLLNLVQEKLFQVKAHEEELLREYQVAEQQAVALNDRMAELQILENNLQRLRNLHDMLLDRIANIDLKQNRADVRVALLSSPTALARPVAPRKALVLFVTGAVGLTLGSLLVYLTDLIDDRFRSPEEMKAQLGIPLLAVVRELPEDTQNDTGSVFVQVHPTSPLSEAFRTLRTTLTFASEEIARLAITSAEPGDGKTTICANLAAVYAQAGKRTLLVDADLRRPGLSRLFGARKLAGLTDILRGTDEVADLCPKLIQPTGYAMLDLLPCGPKSPHPAELLSHPRFAELVAWAEQHYDQVLIDCPPVMAATDAAIVGRHVDGIVLVVQPGKNHRRVVLRAVEQLSAMGVRLLGLVVNRISDHASEYGYGYGYGYAESEPDVALDKEGHTAQDEQPAAGSFRRLTRRRKAA